MLQVTTLGRYGMNTSSQCRIPVGAFYGHTLILPWQLQPGQPHPVVMNKASAQVIILAYSVHLKTTNIFSSFGTNVACLIQYSGF